MMLSRRALLGAALGGGSMVALGNMPAWAFPANVTAPADRLVLVARGVDPAFAAAAARGSRVITADGVAALSDAAQWFAARPGRRLVGLLSEADGVLFRQWVPASSQWLALGHHREGGPQGAYNRHQITTLPASRGLARHLAAELAAQASDFSVTELPAEVAASAVAPAARASESWEASLGEALGRVAAGLWRPASAEAPQNFAGRGGRRPGRDIALASFVIGG